MIYVLYNTNVHIYNKEFYTLILKTTISVVKMAQIMDLDGLKP